MKIICTGQIYLKFRHLCQNLIKIENLFIKNPFCNDPHFVLFLDFWPLTNASTQYVIIKVIA